MRRVIITFTLAIAVAGSGTATATAAQAARPSDVPASADSYVLLADDGVALGPGTHVDTGAIGVRNGPAGAFLTGIEAEVAIAAGVTVDDPHAVVAGYRVQTRPGSTVGDVRAVTVRLAGDRTSVRRNLTVPLAVRPATTQEGTPGVRDVVVPVDTTRTLDHGNYGALVVRRGGTLVLRAGAYSFTSVKVAAGASLLSTDRVRIVSSGPVTVGPDAHVGRSGAIAPDATLVLATTSADIVPVDGGAAVPALRVGPRARVEAAMRAPEGTIRLGAESTLAGSASARWIQTRRDVAVQFIAAAGDPVVTLTNVPSEPVDGVVSFTAAVTGGTAPVTVQYVIDGVPLGSGSGPDLAFDWNTRDVPSGTYEVIATVVDAWGATSSSVAAHVVVPEPTGPAALLDADTDADVLTLDARAELALTRVLDPASVPERYRPSDSEPGVQDEILPAVKSALEDFSDLDETTRQWLAEQVSPDPDAALSPTILGPEDIWAAEAALSPPPEPELPGPEEARVATSSADQTASPPGATLGPVSCSTRKVLRVTFMCVYATALADYYYRIQGPDQAEGLDPTDDLDAYLYGAGSGGGPNGVPDVLDAAANSFVRAAGSYQRLGFERVAKHQVVFGPWTRGLTPPTAVVSALHLGPLSTMFLPEDDDRLVYLVRHELFHAVQWQLDDGWAVTHETVIPEEIDLPRRKLLRTSSTVSWWLEATAEWGARWATFDAPATVGDDTTLFDQARRHYASEIDDFSDHPTAALATFEKSSDRQYGTFPFVVYLADKYGDDFVLASWLATSQATQDGDRVYRRAIDAVRHVVSERGGDFDADVVDFSRDLDHVEKSFGDNYFRTVPDAALWADEMSGRRPQHECVVVDDTKDVQLLDIDLKPGGTYYLDLVLSDASDKSAIDMWLGFGGEYRTEVRTALHYYQAVDRADADRCANPGQTNLPEANTVRLSCSWQEQDELLYDGVSARLRATLYRTPHLYDSSCSAATLVVTWPTADRIAPVQSLSPTLSGVVSVGTQKYEGTVDERVADLTEYRVVDAPGMGDAMADGAVLSFDIDVPQDHGEFSSLCLYSRGRTNAITLNGRVMDAPSRQWPVAAGRLPGHNTDHSRLALSCVGLDTGFAHSGRNSVQVTARAGLQVDAAFLISSRASILPPAIPADDGPDVPPDPDDPGGIPS